VDVVGRLPNGALGALEAGWLAPALLNRFMALVEPCVVCWRGRCCLLIALASSKTWTKSRCAEGELGPPETAPVNAPAYRLHALTTIYQECMHTPTFRAGQTGTQHWRGSLLIVRLARRAHMGSGLFVFLHCCLR
jgi:hypothetical protein